MEKLKKRYNTVQATLKTLNEALTLINEPTFDPIYDSLRDSAIQRFEYSVDTFWKFLKLYLQHTGSLDTVAASPRSIFKQTFATKIITEKELATLLRCIDNRNITSHSYNEELADEIV